MYRVTLILCSWLIPVAFVGSAIWIVHGASAILIVLWSLSTTLLLFNRRRISSRVLSGVGIPRTGRQIVIGGGYQALLQKKSLDNGCVLRVKSGPAERDRWWHAGTSIREIQHELAKSGLSLTGHPSATATTLGGWVFSNCHGSGGTLWKPCIGEVRVQEQDDDGNLGRTFDVGHKSQFGDAKSESELRKYIIREVEVTPVPNSETERVAFDVRDETDCVKFLGMPSYLRLIIVKPYISTAFVWKRPSGVEENRNWFTELVFPPWLATILPSFLFRFPNRERWNRRMSLQQANVFGPSANLPLLELMVLPLSLLYTNFELFVVCNVSSGLLFRIVATFEKAFSSGILKGRVDIRCGEKKLFLDCALTGSYSPVFELLQKAIPHAQYSLHRGKFQPQH